MSDEELNLDLTIKKKKKSKKPFDFSGLGDEESSATAATSDEQKKVDLEDLDDDLGDLTALKKKKKKKKPFNLDDLENALPDQSKDAQDDEKEEADAVVDDLDFDFTAKKKKKKKKATLDLPEDDDLGLGIEDGDGDKENANSAEDGVVFGSQQKWLDSDRDYTYDEMLELIYAKIKEKNPESETGTKKKMILRPPQVLRVGTKKTSFANFIDICKLLHRQTKHAQSFLLTELGTSGSVDAANQLIIKGRFQQKQIESVLRKYIREYVACQTCKSSDTILQKETRLFFLQCESCGSRRSVANIKSGFQAVTGRRAAARARAN